MSGESQSHNGAEISLHGASEHVIVHAEEPLVSIVEVAFKYGKRWSTPHDVSAVTLFSDSSDHSQSSNRKTPSDLFVLAPTATGYENNKLIEMVRYERYVSRLSYERKCRWKSNFRFNERYLLVRTSN